MKISGDSGGRVQGVVMDPKDQLPGEDDASFFRRLEDRHDVDAYFFILPLACKPLGVAFEAGTLQRDFQWGRAPVVHLFVQEGAAVTDGNETWSFREKGHRTRYFSSLARVAHNVQVWRDFERLVDDVVSWAVAEDGH